MHKFNIIHADLKPDNILISQDNNIVRRPGDTVIQISKSCFFAKSLVCCRRSSCVISARPSNRRTPAFLRVSAYEFRGTTRWKMKMKDLKD